MMREPRIRRLLRLVVGHRSIQRDVDDEMQFHLQTRVEDLVREGKSREEAERQASREYGDVSAARSELTTIDERRNRSRSRREWLASLGQDVRFGLRGFRSRPVFTLTILSTLALGIGANAAVFSFVDSVLLRPLPFARPDRLVHLWETFDSKVDNRSEASYPDYLEWRARNTVFRDLGGYQVTEFLVGAENPTKVGGARVTANFFDVLGVRPSVGRTFAADEDAPGAPKIALLTYGFWQREFGGDRSVVGRAIRVDGIPATIVGILPESFRFSSMDDPQVIVPIDRSAQARRVRDNHWLYIVARLRDGVDVRAATSNLSAIMRDLAKEYPESSAGRDAIAIPLHDQLVGSARPVLLLLYGAVVIVILISCVNVANLLLIRGAERGREFAVRAAMGAGRPRLVRQLLTEGLVLAISGGAIGLLVAKLGVNALVKLLPATPLEGFPSLAVSGLDARVVIYTTFVSVVAGIGFGLAPALSTSQLGLGVALRQGTRGSSGGNVHLRDGLVSAEIALTVVLLTGAVLFGKSLLRLLSVDPGFKVDHIVTTNVALPRSKYAASTAQTEFYRRLDEEIARLPGVESVGLVSKLPLDGGDALGFDVVGRPSPNGKTPRATYRSASREYFHAMRIPIIQGRVFATTDDAHEASVAVISRTLADDYFASENPVGQRLYLAGDTVRIIGVVGDVPIENIGDRIPPTVYLALGKFSVTSASVAIRTTANRSEIARELRSIVSSIDPAAAFTPPTTMEDLVSQSPSVFLRRFPMFVVGAFAFTALLLAIVGIYGVVSYSVAQRTREMGIRMALGAQRTSVVGMILRHGATLSGIGILAGAVVARLLGHFVSAFLFGVRPGDPLTYLTVASVLAAVAVIATIPPARRAIRVDPSLALRSE